MGNPPYLPDAVCPCPNLEYDQRNRKPRNSIRLSTFQQFNRHDEARTEAGSPAQHVDELLAFGHSGIVSGGRRGREWRTIVAPLDQSCGVQSDMSQSPHSRDTLRRYRKWRRGMSTPHRIATVRLTHEELDFVLAALDEIEVTGEFPDQRRLIAAIRGEIQLASVRGRW